MRLLLLGLFAAVSSSQAAAQEAAARPTHARTISATLANPHFKQVLASGHRGAPSHAPENTIPSFEKAIELGADIIEIDVRYTRDGHFVIFHDDTVTRLTGQPGTIEERTLAEVQQLEIWIPEFSDFPKLKIPTLEEAVKYLRNRAIIYLDHKTGPLRGLAEEVLGLKATDNAYIVVRTPRAAWEARAVSPALHLMAAIAEKEPASLMDSFLPTRPTLFELPPPHLTPENVERLHAMGIRVFTNAMKIENIIPYVTYDYLLSRGADVIQTDQLELLVRHLRAVPALPNGSSQLGSHVSDLVWLFQAAYVGRNQIVSGTP